MRNAAFSLDDPAGPYWRELVLGEHRSPRISLGDSVLDDINKEIRRRHPGADVNFEWQELQLMRERMHLRDKPGTQQFATEVRRSVAPDYAWLPLSYYHHMEPLAEWVRTGSSHGTRRRKPGGALLPAWPQSTYRRGRKRSAPTSHLASAGASLHA